MRSQRPSLRSQEGMTLVELLIAIGIGALAMYALTTILWNGTRETQSLTAKNEFSELLANLQTRFGNPALCQEMFANQGGLGKTNIPPLNALDKPGPSTKPVPITLDLGNLTGNTGVAAKDNAHQGTAQVYGVGTKLGPELTILNFELMGKSPSNTENVVVNGVTVTKVVGAQYEIPLHIVVGRRIGGYTTSTTTDTATGIVSTTLTGKSGGETAVGGDQMEKTIILRVTMDGDLMSNSKKITGCWGQNNNYWIAKGASKQDVWFKGANTKGQPGDMWAVGIGQDKPWYYPATSPKHGQQIPFPDSGDGYRLDVGGQLWSATYAYRSDARLKENVREIPDALSRVEQLHGVLFDWIDKDPMYGGTNKIGFIAQEVEKVFPEVVHSGAYDGPKSVAYENLLAPLVEAIKARQQQLDQNEREIAELRKALAK